MSRKHTDNDSPVVLLKNEATRQRWELFHRAISHAKQSNLAAMQESDTGGAEPKPAGPALTIAK